MLNSKLKPQAKINVHKFGGSSLANAECVKRVVSIIKQHASLDDLIVVSANGNTTDCLYALFACADNESFEQALSTLRNTQQQLIKELIEGDSADLLVNYLDQNLQFIRQQFQQQSLEQNRNDVLALGEVWSAKLLAALLEQQVCPANAIDARNVLLLETNNNFALAEQQSRTQLLQERRQGALNILTGFIATDTEGKTQTLGRNGSDYSATIAAHLLNAENVTLWTDVDGVYSADPRIVNTARKLHRIESDVAKELGRLGNPILHANTLKPLASNSIHLKVASSYQPDQNGSEIGHFGEIAKGEISVTHNNELLKISCEQFNDVELQVIKNRFAPLYICQDKSCVVITPQFTDIAEQYLQGQNLKYKTEQVSLLAVVGHKIAERGDIKARFNRVLDKAQPLVITQSDEGHSILAFFAQQCSVELVNKVHSQVTQDSKTIGLVIAGLGNIGQRFLEMLPTQLARVPALENAHLVGLATSKRALINTDGIVASNALDLFNEQSVDYDNQQLVSWLSHHPYDELVLVDITPSEDFSALYQDLFKQGIHVVSANKCAGSSSSDNYQQLLDLQRQFSCRWLVNTTVGAGLPINYAINDLLQSGDSINEISGIFSGTLSWLFANFDGSQSFSKLLTSALEQGYTEPDPRDDLSGLDVQRKLLILARLAGFKLELEDIECQNLVPEQLRNVSKQEFLVNAALLDRYFADKLEAAQQQSSCLRYVARFSKDGDKYKAVVSLETLSETHPFANLTPCDNIFSITSDWYQDNPLIIRGPGAGRDVTAGGLHSDLVNLCKELAVQKKQVELKGIN